MPAAFLSLFADDPAHEASIATSISPTPPQPRRRLFQASNAASDTTRSGWPADSATRRTDSNSGWGLSPPSGRVATFTSTGPQGVVTTSMARGNSTRSSIRTRTPSVELPAPASVADVVSGRVDLVFATLIEAGGMLRTGVEDTFYLPGGEKTSGNGQLIEALAACARRAGRRRPPRWLTSWK